MKWTPIHQAIFNTLEKALKSLMNERVITHQDYTLIMDKLNKRILKFDNRVEE